MKRLKVDNLFVVESPLQALIAVELNLQFHTEKNGVIFRFCSGRDRNNQQIEKILDKSSWSFKKKIIFNNSSGVVAHLSTRRFLGEVRKLLVGHVNQLFIGEFRSQWMHLTRSAVIPNKTILIDDGTATLSAKREFIDKGKYFPYELWDRGSHIKRVVKKFIYSGYMNHKELESPISIASAFFKDESLYPVNFSNIKSLLNKINQKSHEKLTSKVFFFGSKYSEAKIISMNYELAFLRRVKSFYSSSESEIVYCSHRDESTRKLDIIENELGFTVISPEMPAEIFLLGELKSIKEVAAAYSSVLNNVGCMLPEVKLRAFYLEPDEIAEKYKDYVLNVYSYFKSKGITIET